MVLVDTSIWVDHLRAGDPALQRALDEALVLTHPFVRGELACGNLKNRDEILGLLAALPPVIAVTDSEVLAFIEKRNLMGRGIGYIDVHLLASAILAGEVLLWTRDHRLAQIAAELEVEFRE